MVPRVGGERPGEHGALLQHAHRRPQRVLEALRLLGQEALGGIAVPLAALELREAVELEVPDGAPQSGQLTSAGRSVPSPRSISPICCRIMASVRSSLSGGLWVSFGAAGLRARRTSAGAISATGRQWSTSR